MNLLRSLGLAALFGCAIVTTYVCTARAGFSASAPINIDLSGRTASGSLGSVRNSSDGNQFIFCYVHATTSATTGGCWAYDGSTGGLPITCSTTNQNLIAAMQKIPQDAWIGFGWDTSGNCTTVTIDQGSAYEVKGP